jgi:hypothetical protein
MELIAVMESLAATHSVATAETSYAATAWLAMPPALQARFAEAVARPPDNQDSRPSPAPIENSLKGVTVVVDQRESNSSNVSSRVAVSSSNL